MLRISFAFAIPLALAFACSANAQFVTDGSGVLTNQVINTTGSQPGNNTGNWQAIWDSILGVRSGAIVGLLERVLFFAVFFHSEAAVVAIGWLGFKAASKWAAWQHLVKVPEVFDRDGDPGNLQWFQVRNALGSRMLTSFLVGTLANLLCGLFGVWVAEHLFPRFI